MGNKQAFSYLPLPGTFQISRWTNGNPPKMSFNFNAEFNVERKRG